MELDVLSVDTGIDARSTSRQRRGSSMPGAAVGQELFRRWLDRYDIAAIDRLVRIHRYIAVEIAEELFAVRIARGRPHWRSPPRSDAGGLSI